MTIERMAHWAMILIGVVALFAALSIAGDILAPMTLALVLGVVLSPLSNIFERIGVGKAFSALLVMAFSLVLLASFLLFMGPYLSRLWAEAPVIWEELRITFLDFQELLRGLEDAQEEVAKALDPEGSGEGNGDMVAGVPSLTDAILAAPAFAAQLVIFIGSLFFFVLTRKETYAWLAEALYGPETEVAHRLEEADRMVSRYFLTIGMINIGLGICEGLALWAIGVPSPILWGVIATLMNFILYLGPALVAVSLLITGIVVFDGVAQFLPPLVYMAINFIEGQFVTPMLVGRHINVNPLLIFLSLVIWLWLWGPVGGIVAIPLLIWGLAVTGRLGHMRSLSGPAVPPV